MKLKKRVLGIVLVLMLVVNTIGVLPGMNMRAKADYNQEVKQVGFGSSEQGVPGSWHINKSAEWIEYQKVRLSLGLEVIPRIPSKTDVIVVADTSGSMSGEKLSDMKAALLNLIDILLDQGTDNTVALIGFSDVGSILSDFTDNHSLLESKVNSIIAEGHTNYYDALVKAEELLADYNVQDDRAIVMLFITDGRPDTNVGLEAGQYIKLKNLCPELDVTGIQYELGKEISPELAGISDRQYSADMDTINAVLSGACLNNNDALEIAEYIDTDCFIIESASDVKSAFGDINIEKNDDNEYYKVIWDLSDASFGTQNISLDIDLTLKNPDISDPNNFFIPTSLETDVSTDEGSDTYDFTPVLKGWYLVYYDANKPDEESGVNTHTEAHFPYDRVSLGWTEGDNCDGYEFKGWEIVSPVVEQYTDDSFVMPADNVYINGTWGRFFVKETIDGELTENLKRATIVDNDYTENRDEETFTGRLELGVLSYLGIGYSSSADVSSIEAFTRKDFDSVVVTSTDEQLTRNNEYNEECNYPYDEISYDGHTFEAVEMQAANSPYKVWMWLDKVSDPEAPMIYWTSEADIVDFGVNSDCRNMFEISQLKVLDLSDFDLSKVYYTYCMFSSSYTLRTIYVNPDSTRGFNISELSSGYQDTMFYGCPNLTGGAGTKLGYSRGGKDYAIIDGTDGKPGYFTAKEPTGNSSAKNDLIAYADGEYTYYIDIMYDGKDKGGVNTAGNQTNVCDPSDATSLNTVGITSGIINVEFKIPGDMEFTGFVIPAGGFGATLSDGTPCSGYIINNDVESTGTNYAGQAEYIKSGLHYTAYDGIVRFKVNELQAGGKLTVAVIATAPSVEVEERKDFYSYVNAYDDKLSKKSNSIHYYIKGESCDNTILHTVKYEYTGTVPEGAEMLRPDNVSYPAGNTVSIAAPVSIPGYRFSGWSIKSGGATMSDGYFDMPDNDVVLLGSFETNDTYNVTYMMDGIKPVGYEPPEEKEYYEGDTVTVDSLAAGTKIGDYKFSGWCVKSGGVSISDDGKFSMPNNNVVLKGSFERVKYSVGYAFYDYDGVILPSNVNDILADAALSSNDYTFGSNVQVAAAPITVGTIINDSGEMYEFLGWDKGTSFTMPKEDVTIRGEWRKIPGTFEPQISIENVNGKDSYHTGDTISYKITVTNTADYAINNITIRTNDNKVCFADGEGYTIISDNLAEINEISSDSSVVLYASYSIGENESGTVVAEAEFVSGIGAGGQILKNGEYTASIGNTISCKSTLVYSAEVGATCEADGHVAGYTCSVCGTHYSDANATNVIDADDWKIPATGHEYGTVTYTWGENNATCTARKDCIHDGCDEYVDEEVTAVKTETPATCESKGSITYTATFTKDGFGQKTVTEETDALGHKYGTVTYTWGENNATCTARKDCIHDGCTSYVEEEVTAVKTETPATCEGKGSITYTATFTKDGFGQKTVTEETDALGHEYGTVTYTWGENNATCTARKDCIHDGCTSYIEEKVTAVKTETPATCEGKGSITYTATFTKDGFEQKTVSEETDALGHEYGTVAYTWSDDSTTCTARKDCLHDGCTSYVEEKVTAVKTETPATCEEKGSITYTATFTKDGFEQKTVSEETDALGHEYGTVTYTWSDDSTTCTARKDCIHDGCTSYVEEKVTAVKTETPATCESKGSITYTATFTKDGFEQKIVSEETDALGHEYGTATYTWSDDHKTCTAKVSCIHEGCQKAIEEKATGKSTIKIDSTTEKKGTTTYTAEFTNKDVFETCSEDVEDIPEKEKVEEPGGNTEQPGGNTEQPGGNTEQPGGNTEQPGGNTEQPSGNTEQPGGNTEQPGGNTEQPGGDTEQPSENTEPVVTENADGSVTVTSTVKNDDGSTLTTKKTTYLNGKTTEVDTLRDASGKVTKIVTQSHEVTKKGTMVETNTVEIPGGEKTETTKKTSKSGKVVTETVITSADGAVNKTTETVNTDGSTSKTTTKKNSNGKIVSKVNTVKNADGSSIKETVKYDSKGKVSTIVIETKTPGEGTVKYTYEVKTAPTKKKAGSVVLKKIKTNASKIVIPYSIEYGGKTYKVSSVKKKALKSLGENVTVERN